MATKNVTISKGSNWQGKLQFTYETFAGGIKITQIGGCKESKWGSRTYQTSATTVYVTPSNGYQQSITLSHYVDFPVSSSYTSWNPTPFYILGSGDISITFKLPSMSNGASEASVSFTLTAPAYTGPAIS